MLDPNNTTPSASQFQDPATWADYSTPMSEPASAISVLPVLLAIVGIGVVLWILSHRRVRPLIARRLGPRGRAILDKIGARSLSSDPDAPPIPAERDPQARGVDEPDEYASWQEWTRLYHWDPRFLARRLDIFLEQPESEDRLRQFCEDHPFLAVAPTGTSVKIHLRVFTEEQLAHLPAEVARQIQSERLRRREWGDARPALAVAPGGNGNTPPPSTRRRGRPSKQGSPPDDAEDGEDE